MYCQFGKAEEQIRRLSGEEYRSFRLEHTDEGRTYEEFGIIYNNGINATKPGGLVPIYHFIDGKEAEQISILV